MKYPIYGYLIYGLLTCALAATSAHAQDKWTDNFRRCDVSRSFQKDDSVIVTDNGATVSLHLDDLLELQKLIPALKKCERFLQCVSDREAGKVKHCYENDRRWR